MAFMSVKFWTIAIFSSYLLLPGFHRALAESLPPDSSMVPFDVGQRRKPPDNAPPRVTNQNQIYDFMWETLRPKARKLMAERTSVGFVKLAA